MRAFLKIIRFKNILLLALMQITFHFGFLKLQNIPLALNDWQFLLLVFSTICIAGAGYLINNVFDQETDQINKPNDVVVGKTMSETTAYNLYIILNVLGVGTGFYLSNSIGKPSFAALFIVIAATLYLYASSLKQSLLVGNILIALLAAISVIIVGLFDLYPTITVENKPVVATYFEIILDYAFFAFLINFIRELVKDLEDVKGDCNTGMATLPIILGVKRTSKLVFGLSLIPIIILFYYINNYYFNNKLYFATLYSYIFIVAPLLYFTIKMWTSKSQKEFHHLSTVLKVVLFFGILSILVITLNIKYNA
jgi:4-hydroxybenzoate polyprenyltransferase